MSLCTAGVTRTDNAVQAVSSCQILLSQASVLSRVTAKQGLLQHQKPKPKSCFWRSNRERQATWLCRDAMRQVWQQLPQRTLQPQPCRSSKTIAGLTDTADVRALHGRTACESQAPGLGEAASKGECLCHKNAGDQEPRIQSPPDRSSSCNTPSTEKRPQRNLNIGFIATNHKDTQIRVLGFRRQVEFFKGIKNIRNEKNK